MADFNKFAQNCKQLTDLTDITEDVIKTSRIHPRDTGHLQNSWMKEGDDTLVNDVFYGATVELGLQPATTEREKSNKYFVRRILANDATNEIEKIYTDK